MKVPPAAHEVTGAAVGPSDGPAPARTTGQPSIQSRRSTSIGRRVSFRVPFDAGARSGDSAGMPW
ncbi:hypothetical protein ACFVDT_29275 [Streptomyces sp. NPDC057699]|uniref:hypothetical protein n=1 Tax=Streptomyces sp. NPDC057699 TaxID=3346220 RepID=UPI00368B3162